MPDIAKLTPPIAPNRTPPKPYGSAGFDRVSGVAGLARNWLKVQGLPYTADAVIAMTALALAAQREIDDAEKRKLWEAREGISPESAKPAPSTIVDKPKPAKAAPKIEPSPAAPVAGAPRRPVPKKEPTP